MLYRFKSKAAADVLMLEPVGKRVLELLGKDPSQPGILQVQDMPRAADLLRAAVVADELAREQRRRAHAALDAEMEGGDLVEPNPPPVTDPITLRMRVAPFLELLNHSMRENTDVVWGV
jgi:Domain of unknown function (DUF1840)